MSYIAPAAWRVARAAPPTAPPAPSTKPVLVSRTKSVWPGLLIIVGIPTLLFSLEYATGIITV